MDLDRSFVDAVLASGDFDKVIASGLTPDMFAGEYKPVVEYLFSHYSAPSTAGTVPTVFQIRRSVPGMTGFRKRKKAEGLKWTIDEVKKRARYNRMAGVVGTVRDSLEKKDLEGAHAEIVQASLDLTSIGADSEIVRLTQNTNARWKRYVERRDLEGMPGVPTGVEWLDEVTLGWQKSDFVLAIAPRGTGKTWFALLTAHAAFKAGNSVLLVSLEMASDVLQRRFDALYSKLPYQKIRQGDLTKDEERKYRRALRQMREEPAELFIPDFDGVCTPLTLQAMARENQCNVVVVDGMYMLNDDKGSLSGWEMHASIANSVKRISRQDGIVFVGTTQFNSEEKNIKKDATLRNVAYSRAYGDAADVALKLYRGEDEVTDNVMLMELMKLREDDKPDKSRHVSWNFDDMEFGASPTYEQKIEKSGGFF